MTEKIAAATVAINSAKEMVANATGVATESAKAGIKAVATSDLAAAAGSMATNAAAEIGKAAGSLAKAGSKWAYIWMAQRMASQILSTVVTIIMIIAVVYVAVFFMRIFVNKMRECWESHEFINKVSNNIKHQIALDNTKLLEDVTKNKYDVHDKVIALTNKVKRFEEIQKKYEFESLKQQLHDVLQEYRTALSAFDQRMNRMEAVVDKIARNKK